MYSIGAIAPEVKADERQLLLFWALHNPMTVTQMADRGFLGKAGLKRDSYERAFRRICEDFAENGIYVELLELGEETSYRIDVEATYVNGVVPTQDELLELILLVGTYLEGTAAEVEGDTGRGPYLDCLRRARDKLACSGNSLSLMRGTSAPVDGEKLHGYSLILDSYVNRLGVAFDYTDSAGAHSSRDVDVYGVFRHGGQTFFVGFDHTRSGIRVFRDDRIDLDKVRRLSRTFEVPGDFCTDDYEGLPFEYGTDDLEATFACTVARDDVAPITASSGRWDSDTWHVRVRNVASASSWACDALDRGLVPLEPDVLVDTLREGLAKVVERHG